MGSKSPGGLKIMEGGQLPVYQFEDEKSKGVGRKIGRAKNRNYTNNIIAKLR